MIGKSRETFAYESGIGRCKVEALVIPQGPHLVVIIQGGESHIGAIALGEPYKKRRKDGTIRKSSSVSLISRQGHKEDEISYETAKKIAEHTGEPVLVCCGIHLEDPDVNEINTIIASIREISQRIIDDAVNEKSKHNPAPRLPGEK